MDKDRIAGAAKDAAGKVEGAFGKVTGDAETEASGRVREAAGTVQNLYGQALLTSVKDAGRHRLPRLVAKNSAYDEQKIGRTRFRRWRRGPPWRHPRWSAASDNPCSARC